ncbi:MAG TPA: non-heme iron oxygenase ferredoxin subunit [Patescibacteria group bacterium]|jgi:nitrite reductase/ring-hydroxylating ferredoxin subunit|nr:non-heme iron oxygenase ferredoxin subunit [Patescibacteria group bacterium]
MPEFVKAAKVSDIKPGEARVVECGGKTLALCHVEGKFYALDNTCLHRGGPIGEGFIDGETVTCPWHGWQYDVKTGEAKMNASAKLATFETKVEGEDVLISV